MDYKFEITHVMNVTEEHSTIEKEMYSVECPEFGFAGLVTTFQFKENQAYVGKTGWIRGGQHLYNYNFWDRLQSQVLKFHNNLKRK